MFYEPVQDQRYFERDRRYIEINWSYFPTIVDAFERRIRGWYIEPIEILLERKLNGLVRDVVRCLTNRHDGGHYSFTVMAMTCLLIDALSQYVRGVPEGTPDDFKAFVRGHLPNYCTSLTPPIDGYRRPKGTSSTPRHNPLTDVADVLYHGFRCGILHEAHAPLYCGILPGNSPPKIEPTNHAKYGAGATSSTPGTDCPVVAIYPEHLFGEVMTFFAGYLVNLKDKDMRYDPLRDSFKKKFSASFGIDITAATL